MVLKVAVIVLEGKGGICWNRDSTSCCNHFLLPCRLKARPRKKASVMPFSGVASQVQVWGVVPAFAVYFVNDCTKLPVQRFGIVGHQRYVLCPLAT